MTAGEKIGALGMSEPSAGSDLQGIRTYAKQDGDDWIINGSKVFITNGYLSDVVVVVAVTNPQVGGGGNNWVKIGLVFMEWTRVGLRPLSIRSEKYFGGG